MKHWSTNTEYHQYFWFSHILMSYVKEKNFQNVLVSRLLNFDIWPTGPRELAILNVIRLLYETQRTKSRCYFNNLASSFSENTCFRILLFSRLRIVAQNHKNIIEHNRPCPRFCSKMKIQNAFLMYWRCQS